jgi:hypothetical protein
VAALFTVAVLATSTLVAAAVARWGLGISATSLPAAVRHALQFLGLWFLCLALNVGLAVVAVLTFRTVTARFVSVYLVNDVSFLIFSAIQASILHAWLSLSKK